MTSFLALRASVCGYLWCLTPPVYFFLLYRFPEVVFHPRNPIVAWIVPRPLGVSSGRGFEFGNLTLFIYFFTPERAQFCSRCLLRIRTCVLTLALGALFVFRHGISAS